MMNSVSALHKYDLEIRFNRRDLYQTSAFCGHVFTMKLLLKNITLGHMTENKCGYQMHIFVTSFSKQHAPVWRCFCMVQPLRQPFRPKCSNRILQMHHQNPVVPSESGVHPQNPVCTYSVSSMAQYVWHPDVSAGPTLPALSICVESGRDQIRIWYNYIILSYIQAGFIML